MTPEHRQILESQGFKVFDRAMTRLERANPANYPAICHDHYGSWWVYVTPTTTDSAAELWRPE